jgi:hypothetical protein
VVITNTVFLVGWIWQRGRIAAEYAERLPPDLDPTMVADRIAAVDAQVFPSGFLWLAVTVGVLTGPRARRVAAGLAVIGALADIVALQLLPPAFSLCAAVGLLAAVTAGVDVRGFGWWRLALLVLFGVAALAALALSSLPEALTTSFCVPAIMGTFACCALLLRRGVPARERILGLVAATATVLVPALHLPVPPGGVDSVLMLLELMAQVAVPVVAFLVVAAAVGRTGHIATPEAETPG